MNINVGSGHLVLDGFVNLDNSLFLKLSRSPFQWILKPFLNESKKEIIRLFTEASKRAELRKYDCRKRMPFEDNSVSHILCSHFLEHLFHDQCILLLKEFTRVLKPGGTMHVILPDLRLCVERYLSNDSPEAADELMSLLLSYEKPGLTLRSKLLDLTGNFGLHHLWMYDRRSMEHKISQIGLCVDINLSTPSSAFRKGDDSLHIFAYKPLSY